ERLTNQFPAAFPSTRKQRGAAHQIIILRRFMAGRSPAAFPAPADRKLSSPGPDTMFRPPPKLAHRVVPVHATPPPSRRRRAVPQAAIVATDAHHSPAAARRGR